MEPAGIAQRLSGNWNCDDLTMEDILDPTDEKDGMNRLSAWPRFRKRLSPLEGLMICRWKWDGIRANLTMGGGTVCWSRGEEAID